MRTHSLRLPLRVQARDCRARSATAPAARFESPPSIAMAAPPSDPAPNRRARASGRTRAPRPPALRSPQRRTFVSRTRTHIHTDAPTRRPGRRCCAGFHSEHAHCRHAYIPNDRGTLRAVSVLSTSVTSVFCRCSHTDTADDAPPRWKPWRPCHQRESTDEVIHFKYFLFDSISFFFPAGNMIGYVCMVVWYTIGIRSDCIDGLKYFYCFAFSLFGRTLAGSLATSFFVTADRAIIDRS